MDAVMCVFRTERLKCLVLKMALTFGSLALSFTEHATY
jgi:hypothetical protein